jgi:putative hydrolase of the HAD superfamily
MSVPAVAAVSAVLLDLDDTVLPFQTVAHWQWAWRPQGPVLPERHARAAIHRSVRSWDRRRWQGVAGAAPPVGAVEYRLHLHDTLQALAGRPLGDAEVEAVVDRFLKPWPHQETYPDVPPLAAWLKAHQVPFAVLTPFPEELAKSLATRSGLGADVRVLAAPAAAEEPKLPALAAFRAARKEMGGRGGRVVYVGNLYWSDVRAAARAGLESVLLDRLGLFEGLGGTRLSSLAGLPALLEAPPAPPPAEPAGSAETPPAPPADGAT